MDFIESIAREFDELFPDGGRTEEIDPIKDRCEALMVRTAENWDRLPKELQERITVVERELNCREIPVAFHLIRLFADVDLEEFDEMWPKLKEWAWQQPRKET